MSYYTPPGVEGPFVVLARKDRSVGLKVFGVIQVLIGLFCAMAIPVVVMSLLTASPARLPTPVAMIVPALVTYAVAAVAFIWLGVGSILGRRWARALTLIFAWMGLIGGLVTTVFMFLIVPDMPAKLGPQGNVPPGALLAFQIGAFGGLGCVYVLLPAIFVAFYQRGDVKATCERMDPLVRWTDRCPLPVLAMSVLLALGVPSMLFLVFYNSTIPFFGMFLQGLPGAWVVLILAGLFAWLSWGAYHQKVQAWWGTLALVLLLSLSSFLTLSRTGMMEMYRQMGYSDEMLTAIRTTGMVEAMDKYRPWTFLVYGLVFLGFLRFTWKHFFVRPGPSPAGDRPDGPGELGAGS